MAARGAGSCSPRAPGRAGGSVCNPPPRPPPARAGPPHVGSSCEAQIEAGPCPLRPQVCGPRTDPSTLNNDPEISLIHYPQSFNPPLRGDAVRSSPGANPSDEGPARKVLEALESDPLELIQNSPRASREWPPCPAGLMATGKVSTQKTEGRLDASPWRRREGLGPSFRGVTLL